jgi:hypothetical protein
VRSLLKFFGGAGILALSALSVSIATLISVPIVLGQVGESSWLSIAVGQAIGELARVFVIWGWNSIGLTIVAAMDGPGRVKYYLDSLVPRLLLCIAAVAACVGITMIMPLHDRQAALAVAVAGAIYGLNASWVFVGGKEPLGLLKWDALPRAATTILAALALFVVPSALIFGVIVALGCFLSVAIPAIIIFNRARRYGVGFSWQSPKEIWRLWKTGFPAFVSVLILVSRMTIPVIVAPIVAPAIAPAVALGDKFLRWANTGMTPLIQTLQVKIASGHRPLRERALRGMAAAWGIGGFIGLMMALVIPWASNVISHGKIELGLEVSIPVGIVVTFVFVASITGNSILVLLGKIKSVVGGAAIGLTVIVVAFVPLTLTFGAAGAFWAFALSELAVTLTQLSIAYRSFRRLA